MCSFFIGNNLHLVSRDMRSSDMNDTVFVFSPPNFWNTTHFAKYEVNILDCLNALVFLDTVANCSPCVICGELNFNTIFSNSYIRKCLWVRRKNYLKKLSPMGVFIHCCPHAPLKFIRRRKALLTGFIRKLCANFIKEDFKIHSFHRIYPLFLMTDKTERATCHAKTGGTAFPICRSVDLNPEGNTKVSGND